MRALRESVSWAAWRCTHRELHRRRPRLSDVRAVARRRAWAGAGVALLVAGGLAVVASRSHIGEGAPLARAAVTSARPTSARSWPDRRSPTATSPSATSTSLRRDSAARGVVLGVFSAAGVRQWVKCAGNGPVTVVVITGLAAPATSWSQVLPSLQAITRTCVYDRPGLGQSPPRADMGKVVDAGLYSRELAALLAAAGERGPFVVVGHSFGGLIARAFVRENPARVRGLLLAESVTPNDPTLGPYWSEADHRVDMAASSAATGGGPPLGGLPLLVLSASDPEGDHLGGPAYGQPAATISLWRREQASDLALSSDAIQVIAHSGHVVQQDDPAAVAEAVRELVVLARVGGRLRCTATWSSVDARCI